jgi:hypothetical protein
MALSITQVNLCNRNRLNCLCVVADTASVAIERGCADLMLCERIPLTAAGTLSMPFCLGMAA